MKKKFVIWPAVVLLVGFSGWKVKQSHDQKQITEVDIKKIERKDLHTIISASGKIEAKTMVDVSAAVSGKVVAVDVREGDHVVKGQRLLRLDPKPFETQVQQLDASIESAKANVELQQAQLKQSEKQLQRSAALAEDGLLSDDQLDRDRTAVEVEQARLKATEQEITRLEASLAEARHELTKVDVVSDIDGSVTAVNIEAGEYAFVGAFNNPATVLLSVADLEVIEAEVEVDETEAIMAKPGQLAELEVDAHPDWIFRGVVTEVGHSPVTQETGGEREGTSYLVKIAVQDKIPDVRPGLTCSAKIYTDERKSVLAVPIQALTMRKPDEQPAGAKGGEAEGGSPAVAQAAEHQTSAAQPPQTFASPRDAERLTGSNATRRKNEEGKVEGVLCVRDGKVWFEPVTIGITGEKDFELLAGLEEGTEIVVGPFKALRELKEGAKVRPAQQVSPEAVK